jgi:hypothetical protein
MSYCKDCTSRNAPSFVMTDRQWQKFRLFFRFVTDRSPREKMSLGQNLERYSTIGKIVRQSVCNGTGVQALGAESPTKGMFFCILVLSSNRIFIWMCKGTSVPCTLMVRLCQSRIWLNHGLTAHLGALV